MGAFVAHIPSGRRWGNAERPEVEETVKWFKEHLITGAIDDEIGDTFGKRAYAFIGVHLSLFLLRILGALACVRCIWWVLDEVFLEQGCHFNRDALNVYAQWAPQYDLQLQEAGLIQGEADTFEVFRSEEIYEFDVDLETGS
jgi:hypothetical protein